MSALGDISLEKKEKKTGPWQNMHQFSTAGLPLLMSGLWALNKATLNTTGAAWQKKSPLFKVITRELKLEKTWNVFDLCQEKPVKVSHPIDIGKFQRGSQDLQPHMDQWNTRRHQSPQEP